MSEQNRSLEEIKREYEEAAIALANQVDASRELDSLMRKKKLASMEPQLDAMESENDLMARFGTERRENRACAIENLEWMGRGSLPIHSQFYSCPTMLYFNKRSVKRSAYPKGKNHEHLRFQVQESRRHD